MGYKLWEILSEQLGQDINKYNFRSTFERLELTLSQLINQESNQNFRFHSCLYQCVKNDKKAKTNQNIPVFDLKQAPKIKKFYGREKELSALSHWLEHRQAQLISVLGIAGIGKSTLVRYFLDINTASFDVIIWKNLKLYPSLDILVSEILTDIHTNENSQNDNHILRQLFNLLNQKRCLIILDNLEEIFIPQQLAGQHKAEYKKSLLQMITEMEHQSCFIFISQEKCQEMISLDNEFYPSHCLELLGLGESAKQIFKTQGLQDDETWLQLIDLYEGNPRYLQSISILIKDLFAGKVSDFLQEKHLILTEDIQYGLAELYNRLSPIEKQIALELGCHDRARTREDLKQILSLSSMELINGLQYLNRRYLIKIILEDDISFNLSPVFREYVKNFSQD